MTLRIGRAIAFLFGMVVVLSVVGPASAATPGKAFGAIAPAAGAQTGHERSSSNIIRVQDRRWQGGQQRARRGQQRARRGQQGARRGQQRARRGQQRARRGNVQRRQFRRAQRLNQRNRQVNRRANRVQRRANRVNRRAARVNRRAARVNRGWRGRNYRRNLRWRNRAAWNRRHNIWRRYPRPPRWGRPGPGARPWRYWRGHRYYWYRDGWWPYAWLGGVVVLPSATYYYNSDPAPAPAYGPKPWTSEWYAYCSSKYRTFNPRTGYYYYKPGRQRFCR